MAKNKTYSKLQHRISFTENNFVRYFDPFTVLKE